MVFTAPQPALKMNMATITPATPSMGNVVYCPAISAARTTPVAITSEIESEAVAAMEGEFMRLAIFLLK